jgi:hypothetical protein
MAGFVGGFAYDLLLQAVGRMGSGRQEAGEEGKWKVVAREDVGCGAFACGKFPYFKHVVKKHLD